MGFAQIQLINGPTIVRPTIEATVGAKQSFDLVIKEEDGELVDLTPYSTPDYTPAAVSCQLQDLPITTGIQFVGAEFQGQARPSVSIHAEIIELSESVVRVQFDSCTWQKPGIYLAELQLISNGNLDYVFRMYVDMQPTLAWQVDGPLSIAEVRLWARDSIPEDNFLLDEVEFKDAEIAAAIRRAVDIWNTTTPVLARYTFTYKNFPFRSQWLDLTIALLYRIASLSYLRNHLPYQAAGVSVDDKNKYAQYSAVAATAMQEFTQWAKETKLQLNVQQAWGSSKIFFRGGCGRTANYGYYSYYRY